MDLMAAAETDDGGVKYIAGLDIVLFQAREFGGQTRFRLQVPAAGRYWLRLQPWRSPSYSAASFSLDGSPIGEQFVGTAPEVGPAPVVTLGPVELTAGEHTLGVTTVRADAGEPWISLQSIALTERPEEAEAGEPAPSIAQVRRIATSGGATALEVRQTAGPSDRFVYAGTPGGPVKAGDLSLDGFLRHLRMDGERVMHKASDRPIAHGPNSGWNSPAGNTGEMEG